MASGSRSWIESLSVLGLVGGLVLGCAENSEPLVPERNQKKAEERYGKQQMMMQGLNQTPAEQAAARHEDSTVPVEQPSDKNENNRD